MDLMYVIGEPGIGKSTFVAHLTRDLPFADSEDPLPHRLWDGGVLELGKRRETFPGTDSLALNIQPRVFSMLATLRPPLVLAEGDRLANPKFFDWATTLGYRAFVYNMWGAELAEARRAQRGHVFDPVWLAGRQSKVERLAYRIGATGLDASMTLEQLEEAAHNPVTEALRAARAGRAVPA